MFDFSLQRIKAIFQKELIQLKRDKASLLMISVVPIIQLLLFVYAVNTDPKHLPTAVMSRDNTLLTRSIVAGLQNSEYFKITQNITSDEEGDELLKSGKVMFVISIPNDFMKDVIRQQRPKILIEADASEPYTILGALASLEGIIQKVIREELKGNLTYLKDNAPAFSMIVHKTYNPEGITKYSTVPALVGMILMSVGIVMTALTFIREKERGTMENLLSMPIHPFEVMIGKITPFIFIGIFQACLILLMSFFLFHIPIVGSLSLLFICMIVFIICNLSLGFLVSTISKNQVQALQLCFSIILPSLVFAGVIFPLYGMPTCVQYIAKCIPLMHFVRIARAIMLKGSGFIDILSDFWPLILIATIITTLTIKTYKKTLD